MALKEILREKLPEDILLTSEYKVLSSLITKEKIATISGLKDYVDNEIRKINEWMRQNTKGQREGTMTRWIRQYTKKLDFLMLVKSKVLSYL